MKKTTKKNTKQLKNQHIIGIAVVIFIATAICTFTFFQINHLVPEPVVVPEQAMKQHLKTPADATITMQKQNNSVTVILNTGTDTVSGVQLALSYDPKVITNVTITPGTLFNNPIELENSVDETKGTIDYALAIQPNQQSVHGQGTIATISYHITPGAKGSTQLSFRPQTKVTTLGVNMSVLKSYNNILIP